MESKYDQLGEFYLSFVKMGLADPQSMFHLSMGALVDLAGDVEGKVVCDLACGEGYLARQMARKGASVTAVDISAFLLQHAEVESSGLAVEHVLDDAQSLQKIGSDFYDVVVCSLALMDIPDIRAVFNSVARILKCHGRFAFSVLHPCFETPFRMPESHLILDATGNFDGYAVRRYREEGYWTSGGEGMRGRVGAHHRVLSSYLNGLIESGFRITAVREPILPAGNYSTLGHQINSRIGQLLVVACTKTCE
jgi:SAM-dependent methyltransferase